MVTRVDKKPIIYCTTAVRAWRPIALQEDAKLLKDMLQKSIGIKIPSLKPHQVFDDIDDILRSSSLFDDEDVDVASWLDWDDEPDDETIRIARQLVPREMYRRARMKACNIAEVSNKIVRKLVMKCRSVYYGTEAVYQLYSQAVNDTVFCFGDMPHYWDWAQKTAIQVCSFQSPYMFIHPAAVEEMTRGMSTDLSLPVQRAWCLFKKMETLALRLGSRKNLFAHAYHSGVSRRAFDPSKELEDDFEIPLTGFCKAKDHVKMYTIGGLKYFVLADQLLVFSHDDCVNLATMAQCYFRVGLYFSVSNAYPPGTSERALCLLKDIAIHACKLIDCKKNFSHIIRSMHILAQRDFNDIFEDDFGTDLGWQERSANYLREANELDRMGSVFHERAVSLAVDKIDTLNTSFIYHAFVGDEMMVEDLRFKVSNMTSKVLDADEKEWSTFIKFCKSYFLARFMMTNGRKPKAAGDLSQLNEEWARKCCDKHFTMPIQADWGKVWINGEFAWQTFANSWHLEAQDVSYVFKDTKGLKDGKYANDRMANSELLMAMTSGNILDTLTGSTPTTARDRICSGVAVKEVAVTTAPKAENAKPSWKKRVTFAADCEFRKMQAEYDRNSRKIISFIRGPSLGVEQSALEQQFQDISRATSMGIAGAVCSHDISAWSESMDRARKFEFEQILINMLTKPEMINIKEDWQKIKATVLKGGARDIVAIDNSSFQGFDGSASTILHAMILIYCIDTARRKSIMSADVKANMATLIDDCVALMNNLDNKDQANAFWAHLKITYRRLGFEVDDLKSIFSTIKAIYLSRRFLCGGEVPADLKVFIKSHISYEDPLRCSLDTVSDIFGANRGAADANGDPWFIYFTSVFNTLAEIGHQNPFVTEIVPSAAAVFCLAPVAENGWGFPSIVDWGTNDITDKRTHFNAILEAAARHSIASDTFKAGIDPYTRPASKAVYAIKSQAWRLVSYANIFTNPFEAIREGPLKPDMLKRNAISDLLGEVATAEPWVTLLKWSNSAITQRIREILVGSGPLHAPTLSALVNCMPDNYRLSLIGKAVGSSSVMNLLPMGARSLLKRRVSRCSQNFFKYSVATYSSSNSCLTADDMSCLSFKEQTISEREQFYAANGVEMTDHTFPDPVGTFTHSKVVTGSVISPNRSKLRLWDPRKPDIKRANHYVCGRGIYVPRRSGRVWEITSEYGKGWDTVSQRIAMGLAVLARAKVDGHKIAGIQEYFMRAWNEMSNITPEDTHLISIHGSIKRLDSNPGSSSHPIIFMRNCLYAFHNTLNTAKDAIAVRAKEITGHTSHLHDHLAHDTCMLAVTALQFCTFSFLNVANDRLQYNIATRPDCVIAEDSRRMNTDAVANRIAIEVLDSAEPYGLLQACPSLAPCIAIPTMKSSWVKMINALVSGDHEEAEEMMREAGSVQLDELIQRLENDDVEYSAYVVIAEQPARRGNLQVSASTKFAIQPMKEEAKMVGDGYTLGVKTIPSRFNREISASQPEHVSAAIAIKSVVWDRMKGHPLDQLAKVFYEDPDADYNIMKPFTRLDFWRGVITEASKHRRKHTLSDIVMSGFRSLGIPGLHITPMKDRGEVAQAVASYFGANMKDIIKIVAPEVLSIAGRSSRDFEAPIMQKFVTNNPAIANARMRKDHMSRLIEYNLRTLHDRIEAIIAGNIVHRGDKRACSVDKHRRLVELRCRRYVYKFTKISENGSAYLDEEAFGRKIHSCALLACEKIGQDPELVEPPATTFDGTLQFMRDFDDLILFHPKYRKAGWDPDSGSIGARLALDNIITDSEHIVATRFAVSASELAPRVHKRVIRVGASEPVVSDNETLYTVHDDECLVFDVPGGSGIGKSVEQAVELNLMPGFSMKVPIPAWQALYTLLYKGLIPVKEFNEYTGCELSEPVTVAQLREAKLNEFLDEDIRAVFPTIDADYMTSGYAFDETWLDRDEAHAYMVDEVHGVAQGALF